MKIDKYRILLLCMAIVLLIVIGIDIHQKLNEPPIYRPDGWYGFVMSGKVPYIGSNENMKAYLENKGYPECEYVQETVYQVMSTYDARTDTFVDYATPNNISKIKTLPCYMLNGGSVESANQINIQGETKSWRESNEFIRDWKAWG